MTQARFATENVAVTGTSTGFVRIGDEGSALRYHCCPTCGATVHDRLGDGDFTAVPVGALADPAFAPPTLSIHETRRHPWVDVPQGAERRD